MPYPSVWNALLVLGTCAVFLFFAVWMLVDGIRLMWRGEPPEELLPQSGQRAWSFFQGVTFIAIVWIVYQLPVPEGGHAPDPFSTSLGAGAIAFFLTYMLNKIGSLLRGRK